MSTDAWHKKHLSRFGRWLLERQEATGEQTYTPMRYVSCAELFRLRALSDKYAVEGGWTSEQWERRGSPVPIYRTSTGAYTGRSITDPGMYRVEPTKQNGEFFEEICDGGFPYHYANRYVTMYQDYAGERIRIGRAKRWSNEIATRKRITEERRAEKVRMECAERVKPSVASKSFFSMLAISGEINKAFGGKIKRKVEKC